MEKEFLPNRSNKKHPASQISVDFVKFVYSNTSFDGYVALGLKSQRDTDIMPLSFVPISQLATYVENMAIYPNVNYYISANIFSTLKRSRDTLLAINAITIDIDCHPENNDSSQKVDKEDIDYRELSQQIEALVWRLRNDAFTDPDFPEPNYIVITGRGVHLWWCVTPVFAKSFSKNFADVARHFASKLRNFLAEFPSQFGDFRVDSAPSTNAAGYFRLPGSVNTRCGKVAEPIFIHGQRLDLKEFRDQFLPMSTRQERLGNQNRQFHVPIKRNLVGMIVARLKALERLRDLRNAPAGNETRNNFCLLFFVTAKEIYSDKEAYDRTLAFNAGFKCPFTERELKGKLRSARRKEYHYSPKKIADFLGVTQEEGELVGLYWSEKQPSAKERKKDRDRRIVDLFNQGLNQREIADKVQISRQTVNKIIQANAQNIVTLSSKILKLKQAGKTAKEISSELGCSISTVEHCKADSAKFRTPARGNLQTVKVSKNPPIYGCPLAGGEGRPSEPVAATESIPPQPDEKLATLPAMTQERLDEIHSLMQMFPDYFADIDTYVPFKKGILTFAETDALATVADISPARIEAAILGILTAAKAQDGDLFINSSDIVDWVNGFLLCHAAPGRTREPLAATQISDVCASLCDRKVIFDDQSHIYLYDSYTIECETAQHLAKLLSHPKHIVFPKSDIASALRSCSSNIKIKLSHEQNDAIITALTNAVSIITGGPGTGKTTIMAALYSVIRCLAPDAVVRACAPTGKAAVRLTEALGISAKTIHSLLGTQNCRIKCDYLIVDETSMVSLELLHRLLRAVSPSAHIIFVGDPDQLPSIGGGNPLRDMIASRQIPVVTLHQPFRQLGGNAIIEYANKVISAEVVDKLPPCSCTIDDQMSFVSARSVQEVENKVAEITQRLVQEMGVRPKDIQILSPTLDFCGRLNPRLRDILNSDCQNSKDLFYPGDRVIYAENDYVTKICNGQVGTVISTFEKRITVNYNSHIVQHTAKDLEKLTLAYAISIHKAQGSEYPVVIVPVHESMGRVMSRSLVYTAVTRAKEKCIIVGSPLALATAMNRTQSHKSLLMERLQSMCK